MEITSNYQNNFAQPQQLPFYSWLNDFVKLAQDRQDWPVEEVDFAGSRYCGKTRAVATFSNDMCNCYDISGIAIPVCFLIYRKTKEGETEIFNDYVNIFESNLLSSTYKKYYGINNRKFVFANGSSIFFKSVGVRKKKSSAGAGLASCKGDYIVLVFEECFEFSETEMSDIEKAVRGFNPTAKILKMKICNPYYPTLPFLKTFYQTQPIDINAMETIGYQIGIYDSFNWITGLKRKKLLIQANWRAIQKFRIEPLFIDGKPTGYNRYIAIDNDIGPKRVIPQSKLDDLVEDYGRIDYERARVNDLGIPGNIDNDNIFYAQWIKVKPAVWEPHECWRVGVDVGMGATGKSGKTALLWIGYTPWEHGDIYEELTIGLQEKKEMNGTQQYEYILDWLEKMKQKTYEKTGVIVDTTNLLAKVDSSAIEFIKYINCRAGLGNEIIQGRNMEWIDFMPCEIRTIKFGDTNDYKLSLAIPYTRNNFDNGFWRCNKELCPNLDNEFTVNEWKKNLSGETTLKMENDKDHSITAFWYAIEELIIYK